MNSQRKPRWSKLRKAVLASTVFAWLAIGMTAVNTEPASAWTHINCKYSGTSPVIDYRFHSVTTRNRTAINTAQSNWDGTASPGYFRSASWWNFDPELDIYDANYASTAWAWVDYGEHACSSSGGVWNNNETDVHIVNSTTASLSTNQLAIVMVHELGHAYGLGHSSFTCSWPGPAVMRQGTGKFSCGGTAPWNNDVLGVQARY